MQSEFLFAVRQIGHRLLLRYSRRDNWRMFRPIELLQKRQEERVIPDRRTDLAEFSDVQIGALPPVERQEIR